MDTGTRHAPKDSWPRAAFIALATSFGVAITWASHRRFWFAHDEGTLGQAALRVLEGSVPHRDFSHPYTGADALLHALWFKSFGVSLGSIRTGLAIVVSIWLVGMALWVRSRTTSRWAAVGLVAMAVFGPAMYPAAIPSWYVTMFVCGAVALLSMGDQIPSRPALVGAGVLLGIAAGFKVTALYALGGAVLWIIGRGAPGVERGRLWALVFVCAAALGILRVLGDTAGAREWVFVGGPAMVAVLWAGAHELRRVRGGGAGLELGSIEPLCFLGIGFALGLAPVAIWLATTDSLIPFLESLTDVGAARSAFAHFSPPRVHVLWTGLPLLLLAIASYRSRLPHVVTIVLALLLLFELTWSDARWHQGVWYSLRSAVPLGLALAAGVGMRRGAHTWMPLGLVVLAMMGLSQFPFASPIYFVYLVPLAVVGCLGLPTPSLAGQRTLGIVTAGVALIGAVQVVPTTPNAIGLARITQAPLEPLPGSRGGVFVSSEAAAQFGQLQGLLSDSVPPGVIWAGPDSPEVAFLTARRDANPHPFSFLATAGRAEEGIFGPDVVAVVVRPRPPFSPPLSRSTLRQIEARFHHRAVVGPFVVYWGRIA